MEKKIRFIGLIIALIISAGMAITYIGRMWDSLEDKALDLRFVVRGPRSAAVKSDNSTAEGEAESEAEDKVVIISIDEASVEQFGRWPWSRDHHARLVKILTEAGAKAIVFDVILSEPDMVNVLGDMELANETAGSRRVIHCSFFEPRKILVAQKGIETKVIYHEPIEPLKRGAWSVGFTNAYPNSDGGLRACALNIDYEGKPYYPINMLAAALYLDKSPADIIKEIPASAKFSVYDADARMKRSMMLVNFYGPEDSIPSFSYHQILNEKIPLVFKENWVKDKICIIGSKIVGAFDHYPVPFSKMYPGVEFHATIVNNLIQRHYIYHVSPVIILISIILGGIVCGIAVPRFSPWIGTAVVLILTGAYVAGTQWLFNNKQLYVPMVPPMMTLVFSYVVILFYRFLVEEKEKRKIKRQFGQYVSRTVLDEILSNPDLAKLGGERRELSILFSDIRNFTAMSEGMQPEAVVEILNEYLTEMTGIVYKHGGTLDKFIGDAVMAFWGAPIGQPDHACRAVQCALDMMEELAKLQNKWRQENRPIIDIGIGINSGDAVVGNMGSNERMEYTAIGDNVNLASRLEGENKHFKTHIIISSSTYEMVKNCIEAKPLGCVKVKGKEIEVTIFEVTGRKESTGHAS